ncbi:MAG: GTP-binding protein EngB required for normal cell division [Saprospiraceae bacterium]|jgi:GTP-binding protein EngB required for normal cell division
MTGIGKKTRRLLAFAVLLLSSLFLVFVFFATKNALDVWERLQGLPQPVMLAYSAAVLGFLCLPLWLIYQLLRGSAPHGKITNLAIDEASVITKLAQADKDGIDTEALRQEIAELTTRKESGRIYVALFGDISTGKSSLIKALLPNAKVQISAQGGSTQEVKHYTWRSPAGDELVLSDLPGRNESGGGLETLIEAEARRAQLVVYVCDSDLSRSQLQDIHALMSYGKPLIISINKSDQLGEEDKRQLTNRIKEQLNDSTQVTLAFVQSGGEEEIVQLQVDGQEKVVTRSRASNVSALAAAIQNEIDQHADQLNTLRDASVFVLLQQKLDVATAQHRQSKGQKIIQSGTRKAVFGALASISPGSDLVIQGVIGTTMIKELCKLHDATFKDIDIDQFFDFSQGQIKKSVPLLLAVSGNAMKAFPGIGTVTGGITHAFAYGLIFDALGRAVQHTLTQRGALKPTPAAISFTEYLLQNLSSNKAELAKLIFEKSTK